MGKQRTTNTPSSPRTSSAQRVSRCPSGSPESKQMTSMYTIFILAGRHAIGREGNERKSNQHRVRGVPAGRGVRRPPAGKEMKRECSNATVCLNW